MTAKSLNTQCKRLWGASHFPFSDDAETTDRTERLTRQLEKLQHWLSLHSSGFVHGTNGVGKSYLVGQLLGELSDKEYFPLLNAHSTLRGPGLIRNLTQQLGNKATISQEPKVATPSALSWTMPADQREKNSTLSAKSCGNYSTVSREK